MTPSPLIPDRLRARPLIRIKPESKEPVKTADTVESVDVIEEWIDNGGNVGVSLSGDLVVIDVDADRMAAIIAKNLPPTFLVRSGSGGAHAYFDCPEWSANRQFKAGGVEIGSIRTDSWQVVCPPSVHPDTGDQYRVATDRPIARVDMGAMEEVVRAAGSAGAGGGAEGGAPARRVGGSGAGRKPMPSLPGRYPGREAGLSACRTWLEKNGLLDRLSRLSDDHSGDEYVVAKCLAEGGFAETSIRAVLDDGRPAAAKWHQRGEDYRTRTVRNAIRDAADDPHVSWSA